MSKSNLTLHVYREDRLIETRTFEENVVKIGRLPSSHLQLTDHDIARMHAVIEVSGSDVRVVDLGSAAGTRLNGSPVERNAKVGSGDVIEIGPYHLRVVATAAAASTPTPRARTVDLSQFEDTVEEPVAEVIACYGDTALDVQHVGGPQPVNRRPALAILGGLVLLAGLGLVANDVAQDWDGHRADAMAAASTGRPAPSEPGLGIAGAGLLLSLGGLIALVAGGIRPAQRPSAYTVGQTPGVSFAAAVGHQEPLPLVRAGAVAFTAEMTGTMTTADGTWSLGQLVEQGHAKDQGGYYTVPLSQGAKCRLDHGAMRFFVSSVAPGRMLAARARSDRALWTYCGASAAVLGGLLALVHLIPEDAMGYELEDAVAANRFVGYMTQPDAKPDEPPIAEDDAEVADAGGQGQRHVGTEGAMGDPAEHHKDRRYQIKGPKDSTPKLSRFYDSAQDARQAGILGLMEKNSGTILASPFGDQFSVGKDDEDVWGNVMGKEIGPAYGVGGLGVIGSGRGGGGEGHGTVGLGDVGLIGHGVGGGNGVGIGRDGGLHYGRRSGAGFKRKGRRIPIVRSAKLKTLCGGGGCIDKGIIRRVVRSHINEVRHCYNQGLARDPNLRGRLAVQWRIGANGRVQGATPVPGFKDATVARCVSKAVKRWTFPRSPQGGAAMVTYPFVFEPAGR